MAVVSSSGQQRVSQRYSAYGVPFAAPAGDLDADGDVDFGDLTIILGWISAPLYDVRGDLDLDGDVDATDQSILTGTYSGVSLGRGKLSRGVDLPAGGIRKGYAGYEHDGALLNMSFMHVRHRVYMAEVGRWTRRDPLGYVDGVSLYAFLIEAQQNHDVVMLDKAFREAASLIDKQQPEAALMQPVFPPGAEGNPHFIARHGCKATHEPPNPITGLCPRGYTQTTQTLIGPNGTEIFGDCLQCTDSCTRPSSCEIYQGELQINLPPSYPYQILRFSSCRCVALALIAS